MNSGNSAPNAHRTPRWVKLFAIVGIGALIFAFVLMHALGGGMGGHG